MLLGPRSLGSRGAFRSPEFEPRHGLFGKHLERSFLPLAYTLRPALPIQDANRAERYAVRRLQNGACVKAQTFGDMDQRISSKAIILGKIRHNKNARLHDCVPADGHIEREAVRADANLRLEPLAIGGDEIDHGNGCFKDVRSQLGHIVEGLFPAAIEYRVALDRGKTIGLIPKRRYRFLIHGGRQLEHSKKLSSIIILECASG